jgi:hypothetical protein
MARRTEAMVFMTFLLSAPEALLERTNRDSSHAHAAGAE